MQQCQNIPTTSRNKIFVCQNVFLNPGQSTTFGPPSQKASAVGIRSFPVNQFSDLVESLQPFADSDGGHWLSFPRRFFSKTHIQARPLDSDVLLAPVHTRIPPFAFPRLSTSHAGPFQIVRGSKGSHEATRRWAAAQVFGD